MRFVGFQAPVGATFFSVNSAPLCEINIFSQTQSGLAPTLIMPQRGIVPKPGVGTRDEDLPRVNVQRIRQPQRGCVNASMRTQGHNSVGVAFIAGPLPGVAPKAQPRALVQNPVGIPGPATDDSYNAVASQSPPTATRLRPKARGWAEARGPTPGHRFNKSTYRNAVA